MMDQDVITEKRPVVVKLKTTIYYRVVTPTRSPRVSWLERWRRRVWERREAWLR